MFEPRNELGFRLEPSDELGVVGEARVDNLHCHLTANLGLESPVDRAEGPLPDLLQEPVAAQRLTGDVESTVLPEDLLVEALECGGGVDAELLGEDLPCLPEGRQCVALPTRAVEGRHEVGPETLPQWVPG
jgi:hypothetical protein